MTELFRRLVLRELRDADRLRGETEEMLLSWNHSGFSVHATEPILPDDTGRQEHLARYITRAPLRIDAVEFADKSQVKVHTPFDPRTGQRELFLDELELIRRLCAQIPDPRQHMVRYYGHYANRARGARGETAVEVTPAVDDSPTERARRRSWARLLKRVFEVDPLLCPQCGVEMKFVAVIQDFSVVDKILAHLRRIGGNDPHEGTAQRAPSAEVASVIGP